ncbi:MAG TPA: hypothetical protein VMH32_08130 [Burkholderiales bacterium]|nr:hypothetical protein [Burkholderiales bacterium]
MTLLDDAKLVLDYAVRVSALPTAVLETLAHAIDDGEKAVAENRPLDKVALSLALNKSVRFIAPVSLMDLREGRSPFADDESSRRRVKWQRYGLCSLAVAFVVSIAYNSHELHREQESLANVQQFLAAHASDRLTSVRKLAQFEGLFVEPDPRYKFDERRYDQYHQGIRELRNLSDEYGANATQLRLAAEPTIDRFLNGVLTAFGPRGGNPVGESAFAAAPPPQPAARGKEAPAPDFCDKDYVAKMGSGNYPPWLKFVMSDYIDQYCFVTKVNLSPDAFFYPNNYPYMHAIRERIAMQTAWILPILYGALGATIFLMRSLQNPYTPNFSFWQALLRIVLGGVAGLVIGWFWPAATADNATLDRFSSIPFALAFLTGFSIDILFSLLDRFTASFSQSPERSGGAPKEQPKPS